MNQKLIHILQGGRLFGFIKKNVFCKKSMFFEKKKNVFFFDPKNFCCPQKVIKFCSKKNLIAKKKGEIFLRKSFFSKILWKKIFFGKVFFRKFNAKKYFFGKFFIKFLQGGNCSVLSGTPPPPYFPQNFTKGVSLVM